MTDETSLSNTNTSKGSVPWKIVSVDPNIERLVLGYDIGEGPLWLHEKAFFFFSEVKGNKIWTWSPNDGLILLTEQTNHANGLT